jgi:hypothetical protein
MDIVHYLDAPEMKACLRLKKKNLAPNCTALDVSHELPMDEGPKGQFVDGHEHKNIVTYQMDIFLRAWAKLEPTLCSWDAENVEPLGPILQNCQMVVWHHNKSTFYANSWQKIQWVHTSKTAVPYTKGEGTSLMVADFVLANYRWLLSLDEKEEGHVLLKSGKA